MIAVEVQNLTKTSTRSKHKLLFLPNCMDHAQTRKDKIGKMERGQKKHFALILSSTEFYSWAWNIYETHKSLMKCQCKISRMALGMVACAIAPNLTPKLGFTPKFFNSLIILKDLKKIDHIILYKKLKRSK